MSQNMSDHSVDPNRNAKTEGGGKNKAFFALMLAGTIVAAGGYAFMSKGGKDATPSAPFAPNAPVATTEAPKVVVSQEKPKVIVKNAAKIAKTGAHVATDAKAEPIPDAAPAPTASESAEKPAVNTKTEATAPKTQAADRKVAAKTSVAKPKAAPRLAQAPQATVQRVAGGWPEYRGPKRDGISRETGWFGDGEAEMVWKANIGAGFASIAVANGRAYAMGNSNNQDTVYCFDAANGNGIWKYSYACELMDKQHEGGPSATPTVSDGVVYTYSKMGHLNALDAASGKVIWSKNIPQELGGQIPTWGISSTPAVAGDAIFVMTGARNACITAFDKKSGKMLWQGDSSNPAYAALQVAELNGAPYLAAFDADGVKFLDTKSGKTLWNYAWKTAYDVNAAIPVIAGDKVFISSGYGTGCAMLQSTAQNALLWQNRDMKNHFNASVWLNGAIFGFDESELACLDAKTGRKLWSQGRLGKGSLIASDNKLIILSERGELVIADANPQGFKELSRTQILGGKCWTAPALANGRIYARNASGDLVCAKF